MSLSQSLTDFAKAVQQTPEEKLSEELEASGYDIEAFFSLFSIHISVL